MKKAYFTVFILFLFISLLNISSSSAQTGGNINISTDEAVILFMEGEVKVKQAQGDTWLDAKKGMRLLNNAGLKTLEDSWVELGLGRGHLNVLRIQENTLVELTVISPAEINLLQGELRALVENLERDETFEIKTPMSVCGVRGTGWDTAYNGSKVTVDVYENDVFFAGVSKQGESMADPIIKAGKRGILKDPTKAIKIVNVPGGKKRDFSQWKQGYLQRRGLQKGSGGSGGSTGNLQNKLSGVKDTSKGMIKGKEGVFEQKDQDNINNRTDQCNDGGAGYP